MDRLPFVVLLACLACGESRGSTAPPPSRVVAVAATDDVAVEPFCEVTPEDPPRLELPELAVGAPALASSDRVRWVNVWATWCAPCVEEMPRIVRWRDDLLAEGHAIDLVFVSADESPEAVTRFLRDHAEVPSSLRVAEAASLDAWAASLGLRSGATLPLHVLVDVSGRVRCARGGAVSSDGYEALRSAVAAL